MAGAHGAFHYFGHRAEVEDTGVRLGIDFLDGGHKGIVDAFGLEQRAVGLLGARIGAKVVGVVELRGVHEDTHHHHVVLLARAAHKRYVAVVQRAHGGHKTYG